LPTTELRLTTVLLAFLALALSACSSITDLKNDMSERMFGRELAEPPEELVEFKATMTPKVMWHTNLGESLEYDFTPAVEAGMVYAASATGEIAKIDAASGKQVWRINAGEPLSGGVGLGPNLVLVGTPKAYVIAYDQSGKLLWKSKISSEVLSIPQVTDDLVIVRAGDSRIFGLNVKDGSRKWVYERANPALSLRSSAGVVLADGAVYAGFAGGKMIALRAEDGKIIWEVSVALPKGTTEIERIADITSQPFVDGALVYAVAYQGKIAGVDRATGKAAWSREISSYTGLSAEDARVYVAHASGSVYALEYSSGKTFWRQGALKNRLLSAPLPLGSTVAVGDVQGYIHFMDREDGVFTARINVQDSPVMPRLTELGSNGLLAQTRKGGVYAISIK
jgi:outer membrane protein assembly factor BamB